MSDLPNINNNNKQSIVNLKNNINKSNEFDNEKYEEEENEEEEEVEVSVAIYSVSSFSFL